MGAVKRSIAWGGALVAVLSACSSQTPTTRVSQAGLDIAVGTPSARHEPRPAGVQKVSFPATPRVAAAPSPKPLPAPPPSPPTTRPSPPGLTSSATTPIPPLPVPTEERDPPPELVGPDDEALLEKMEAPDEEQVAPEAPRDPEVEYDIPLELHAKVLNYIELFQTTRRSSFTRGLRRSKLYEEKITKILREERVPTDLYYLALIESAFNPRAYSRAKAMGIWQFIYSTGRMYGLRRTHWIDERRDPDKATRAAARHLKDLYEDLGSWPLALAAYNAGVNRVKRSIKKAGTRDFWKLRLPSQTKNYVPAFYAALIIAKQPERYGFDIEYDTPVNFEMVNVDGGTRLSLVATFCNTSVGDIRNLNPELRQGCAPPGGKYSLRIPPGKREDTLAGLARTPKPKITGWGSYRIRSGDTLSTIAGRFGTSVEAIQEVNNLAGHFIRAGDQLVIPGSGLDEGGIPREPVIETAIPPSGTYRVRRGDNLWVISRRFGLSLESLMAKNNIRKGEVLSIGRVLTLRSKRTTVKTAAAKQGRGEGSFHYLVRKGDNLWRIARKFDMDIKTLRRANRITPGQIIYPGDRLLIPGGSL